MKYEIKIEKLVPGGEALGTLPDGKKIFLWGALPGEVVTDFQTTKTKSSYVKAVMSSIIHENPHRVKPLDACYLSTSPWQIMDYGYELEQKQSLVVEFFREHGINIDTPEIITDHNDYHYRNKMEYSLYFDHADEQIHLAFHARGSHQKLPIADSHIEHPEILARAKEIVADLNAAHAEARHYQSLLLRCNQDGVVSGGLYENGHPHPTFPVLKDTILGREYSYSPNGFFQINLPVYELALEEIQKYINTDEVLDLYSGVGTIGLSVMGDRHLTMVECDKSAFQEMVKNVIAIDPSAINKEAEVESRRIHGILARSEDALDFIKSGQTVILDPPRAGLDPTLIDHLLKITPPRIVYLSCNPATQARDVAKLLAKYQMTNIKTFNFFPRTPHIETLVILDAA
ncbi:class I SAM-dependent RNA methyltransferase [Candidatus Saccharibacteria bacterium]|nr:class I SAM-dependent RNA methyltransferase [Candidatus Saccharibacteria bacterium]